MAEQRLDHPRPDAASPCLRGDDHISEVRVGREVADRARECPLLGAVIDTDANRILDSPLENLTRHRAAPVRCMKHRENRVQVEFCAVGRQDQVVAGDLHNAIIPLTKLRRPPRGSSFQTAAARFLLRNAICRSAPVTNELAMEYNARPADRCDSTAKVTIPVTNMGITCAPVFAPDGATDTQAIPAAIDAASAANQRSGFVMSATQRNPPALAPRLRIDE